jgi:hypothetical protein
LLHPRSRVQYARSKSAHEHTGTAGALRHSPRNGFTAYAALSPETNSSCLRHCRLDGWSIRLDRIRHRQLDTSNGCQDHTVLPYAASLSKTFHQQRAARKRFQRRRLSAVRLARHVHSRKTALRTFLAPDAAASIATRPNVCDDGQRPSSRDGMAGVVGVIWGGGEAEYFCNRGWTGQTTLKRLEKIVSTRIELAVVGLS